MRLVPIFLLVLLAVTGAFAQNQPDEKDVEAFFAAVQTGGKSTVAAELGRNPSLATAKDKYGFRAVHLLDYTDFEEILSLLLDHGAEINVQNHEGIGLLHILADAEFLPIVLGKGGNLELRDKQGRTPVMVHLLEPEGLQMVEAMLHAGANPNAKDTSGKSVMSYAVLRNDLTSVELVREAGGLE